MKLLIIINGSAYGDEKTYNGIALAESLAKRESTDVTVYLLGDGVAAAIANQKTPNGYYKLDRMLAVVVQHGGMLACCGTCLDSRGISEELLIRGAKRSTMDELTDATLRVDKVLVF